jgi:uncharacterized repeat protein (TIGR01451 family)
VQGNADSTSSIISADGRYVAFQSRADNLVTGDTNGANDIFVRDRLTGKTTRVSVSSTGMQGNADSGSGEYNNAISADGRYIAFQSDANNLVAGDTNGIADVFVHDCKTGKTTRVSVSSEGAQGNNYYSFSSAISADGRYVAFDSYANNLVTGDTNGKIDTFVHDRVTGKTTRVSVSSEGAQGNSSGFYSTAISADGRYVAFTSYANNLVAGDTNYGFEPFVHDRKTGKTTRVNISSEGEQGNGDSADSAIAISAGGRYVAFSSFSNNLVAGDSNGMLDVFVHDRKLGKTTRVSVSSAGVGGNHWSYIGSISADGRYVAFQSFANNLVAGDTNGNWDIFVHDRKTGKTTLASVSSTGVQGNYASGGEGHTNPISADGRYVAFDSSASNLDAVDTYWSSDVFVRDRLLNTTSLADLQATVIAKPASVRKGQTASYKLTVKNNGPNSAGSVSLTDIVSNGTVLSMIPSQGTCSQATISVCRLGTLAAGAEVSVVVNIRADASSLRQKISVSATPKDNALSNNTVWISTPVIIH